VPTGGRPNGVEHEGEAGRNEGIQAPLPEGDKEREKGGAGRVHQTDRLPQEIGRQTAGGETGKTGHGTCERPGRKAQAREKTARNRRGRPVYGDEVIGSLRKVWAFFRYKCGKILAPLLRQQIACIASWPAFGITPGIAAKLAGISPATIDRRLKKDRAASLRRAGADGR